MLKKPIKLQKRRETEEEKRNREKLEKQKTTKIKNYVKCKWTKLYNQKTENS